MRAFDFAGYVLRHFGWRWRDATYVRVDGGLRTPGSSSSGTNASSTSYRVKARTEPYAKNEVDGARVRTDDRKILIIGRSIEGGTLAPRVNDKVKIASPSRGETTYTLVGEISSDQHEAIWICQGRA